MDADFARYCRSNACSNNPVPSQVRSIETLDLVANVGLFGGAGLIVVGGALFFAITHQESEPASTHARLYVGPGSIGITGRF